MKIRKIFLYAISVSLPIIGLLLPGCLEDVGETAGYFAQEVQMGVKENTEQKFEPLDEIKKKADESIAEAEVELAEEKFQNITLEGPVEGVASGWISFEIDFKAEGFEGTLVCSDNAGEIYGVIDLNTNALHGNGEGLAEYEGHSVPWTVIMEGWLSDDRNSARGTITDEDGDVYNWTAKKK